MRTDLTDETLTAYVLGELDEDEQRAVERALEGDAGARQTVAELRATMALAEDALGADPAPALTDAQRDRIVETAAAESAADGPGRAAAGGALSGGSGPRPGRSRAAWWYAAAAGLLLLVGGGTLLTLQAGRMRPLSAPVTDSEIEDRFAEVEVSAIERQRKEARERIDGKLEEQRLENRHLAEESGLAAVDAAADALPAEPEPAFILDPESNVAPGHDTEAYDAVEHNPFLDAAREPLSTFSIDVDTASYANVRRYLRGGSLPPPGAVRIEELVNYFDYDYELPDGDEPFAADVEVAGCPWAVDHRLVRIGLRGWELTREERPASNLVFLLDVSGSMESDNKLPLLKQAMRMLVEQLGPEDRVALVVYASGTGVVLDSTPCDAAGKRRIGDALDRLQSGGSTHGSAGIQLAYDTAADHLVEGGTNRVILATDGDFNVGQTSQDELVRLLEERAAGGVFLTVLGVGMGNYKDSTLEKLADHGNGNYAYIDNLNEARKVLVDELSATLVTIAKDVKIQVEFNPAEVQAYRLIGYENRLLAAEEFHDDTVDAGEIGAGHTVTALYEVVPPGVEIELPAVDELRYQTPTEPSAAADSGELLTLKLRYKQPDGDTSELLRFPVRDGGESYADASGDLKFAAAVAAFGMLLRDSPYLGTASWGAVLELAEEGRGDDPYGYRAEFLELARTAQRLDE